MALAPTDVLNRANTILQDTTNTRWMAAELFQWMSDGQREVVMYRPEASVITGNVNLTVGTTRQTLPTSAIKLLDVTRNMGNGSTPGRAIRIVAREIMDSQRPTWHSDSGANEVVHYIFDDRDPRSFYVYPKPAQALYIEAVYSVSPAEVTSSSTTFSIPDIYANALLDYVLYRAYLKDSEYAGNAQRAAAHYQAFANTLGVRTQADMQFGPVTRSPLNPNYPLAGSTAQAAPR